MDTRAQVDVIPVIGEPARTLMPAISLITPEDFPPTHISVILNSMVEQALRLRAAGLAPTFLINGEVLDLDGLTSIHH